MIAPNTQPPAAPFPLDLLSVPIEEIPDEQLISLRREARPFREITPQGNLRLNFHLGQWRAWVSTARIIAVIAGAQSGKTTFGPHWLKREIEARGNGDYMVVTPTFPLLELKALKEFRYVFETLFGLGTYYSSPIRKFVFSESGMEAVHGYNEKGEPNFDLSTPTTVYFGYADNPDSLESATVKGIWADEAGQRRFRLASFEALRRRAAIYRARILITTTPYDIGWLKTEVFDRWKREEKDLATGGLFCEVVNFPSILNPLFSIEEFEEAKATLPAWKFAMFYRGLFVKPAGLIYDVFEDAPPFVIPPFEIPDHWPRTLGVDFGAPNIAGIYIATDPTRRPLHHYVYREYRPHRTRSSRDHAARMLRGEPFEALSRRDQWVSVGGSRSETQWRAEFEDAGIEMIPSPIFEVEVGIDRVYGALATHRLHIFANCRGLITDLLSYQRPLDKQGEPIPNKIENKEKFHLADGLRYAIAEAENPDRDWTEGEGEEQLKRALSEDPKDKIRRPRSDEFGSGDDFDDDDEGWQRALGGRGYR